MIFTYGSSLLQHVIYGINQSLLEMFVSQVDDILLNTFLLELLDRSNKQTTLKLLSATYFFAHSLGEMPRFMQACANLGDCKSNSAFSSYLKLLMSLMSFLDRLGLVSSSSGLSNSFVADIYGSG